MTVRYTARANRQIDNIHDYLDERNPEAATRIIEYIRKTVQSLEMFPLLGHAGVLQNTYEIVVPRLPFVVVYRVKRHQLNVLGIYHCAQER